MCAFHFAYCTAGIQGLEGWMMGGWTDGCRDK